jgi:hypothetical protein
MAGLLDIFGTSGSDTLGLLGMSPDDIQKNRDDAQAQALYALAGRLFQGGNTGASIAQGLQQGQQAYKGAMQDTMQDKLQAYQLQELKKKKELEQQALMRQQGVENLITQAYRPQTFADTPVTNILGQEIAGPNQPQAAGLGLESLAPKLMATPEGRKALADLMSANKAMAGDTTTLAEGAKLIRTNPFTGKQEVVAEGAPKHDAMPTSLREFLAAKENPAYAKFLETQTAAKAPKFAVDLKDPTAVAMAGLKMQNDIRQDLKGPKDTATAYQTMYNAATNPTQKGDTTMLYTFFKVLDPQSTVREGEIEMIKQSRSIPEKFKGMAQKLASGQTLLESERADLLNQAYQYVSNQQRGVNETINMYKDYAKSFGLNPENAVPNPFADIKKPPSKTVMINKKSTVAKLAGDGNYYIQSGTNADGTPKYFKVD